MTTSFSVYGIKTEIICAGDDLIEHLTEACKRSSCREIKDGDILVIAESAVATAEGRNVYLDSITPSSRAKDLAQKYNLDPRVAEVVLRESDAVLGVFRDFFSA
jgi:F420-0:gamma-glutamyl ligase